MTGAEWIAPVKTGRCFQVSLIHMPKPRAQGPARWSVASPGLGRIPSPGKDYRPAHGCHFERSCMALLQRLNWCWPA
eukprot:6490249-Amphidinium_carterae.3